MMTVYSTNPELTSNPDSQETLHLAIPGGDGKTTQTTIIWYGGQASVPDGVGQFLIDNKYGVRSLGGTNQSLADKAAAETLLLRAVTLGIVDKSGSSFRYNQKIIANKRAELLDELITNADFFGQVVADCEAKELADEEKEKAKKADIDRKNAGSGLS